jgi:hypothetical protein
MKYDVIKIKYHWRTRETKCQVKWHANWQKISSKVRDKWQRKFLGMPIYATFGSQLFLLPQIYVPNSNVVFHGGVFKKVRFCFKISGSTSHSQETWWLRIFLHLHSNNAHIFPKTPNFTSKIT